MSEKNTDEETFVPLSDKKKIRSRKLVILLISTILIGAAMAFTIIMILRSGGMPRIMFVVLTLLLGYLLYEAALRFKK